MSNWLRALANRLLFKGAQVEGLIDNADSSPSDNPWDEVASTAVANARRVRNDPMPGGAMPGGDEFVAGRRTRSANDGPSPEKAKQILKDDSAQGHPLTEKQKRFMGWKAGGGKENAESCWKCGGSANRGQCNACRARNAGYGNPTSPPMEDLPTEKRNKRGRSRNASGLAQAPPKNAPLSYEQRSYPTGPPDFVGVPPRRGKPKRPVMPNKKSRNQRVSNAWSKAARDAAAASRKAHAASQAATNPSEASQSHGGDADYAARVSGHALTASDKKQSSLAGKYHGEAAVEHDRTGAKQRELGYHGAADLHEAAAAAHRKAAEHHSNVNNARNQRVSNSLAEWATAPLQETEGMTTRELDQWLHERAGSWLSSHVPAFHRSPQLIQGLSGVEAMDLAVNQYCGLVTNAGTGRTRNRRTRNEEAPADERTGDYDNMPINEEDEDEQENVGADAPIDPDAAGAMKKRLMSLMSGYDEDELEGAHKTAGALNKWIKNIHGTRSRNSRARNARNQGGPASEVGDIFNPDDDLPHSENPQDLPNNAFDDDEDEGGDDEYHDAEERRMLGRNRRRTRNDATYTRGDGRDSDGHGADMTDERDAMMARMREEGSLGEHEEHSTGRTRNRGRRMVGNRSMTEREWLSLAPPKFRELMTNAARVANAAKRKLITALVQNVARHQRAQYARFLWPKSTNELQALLTMIGPTGNAGQPIPGEVALYFGAGGGPTANSYYEDASAPDVLDIDAARASYDPGYEPIGNKKRQQV